MKYIRVAEVEHEACTGCVHKQERGAPQTQGCKILLSGEPAFEFCNGSIWIEDTDEAHLAYITSRLTQEAA